MNSVPLTTVESLYVNWVTPLVNFLARKFPPGPQVSVLSVYHEIHNPLIFCHKLCCGSGLYQFLPHRWIINFQKGATFFYVLFMMFYFDNWSLGSYTYLALHGVYGTASQCSSCSCFIQLVR
jgi:hypothetical protein